MDARVFATTVFPPIPLEGDSGFWKGEVTVEGEPTYVSVYVDANLDDDRLAAAATILSDLDARVGIARAAAQAAARTADRTVVGFLDAHRLEIPDALPPTRAGHTYSDEALIAALRLRSIGIHEDEEHGVYVTLDLAFDRKYTDELLAVYFIRDGSVLQINHES